MLYTDHGSDFTSRHLEQVGADLKIRLVFSIPGKPRGRGRIERFFRTLNEMFLCELPGYAPAGGGVRGKPKLTLADFDARLRKVLRDRQNIVDTLLEIKRGAITEGEDAPPPSTEKPKAKQSTHALKRYRNE